MRTLLRWSALTLLRWAALALDAWHARQREIDVAILWPACLRASETVGEAMEIFAVHAYNDPAWLCLGHEGIGEAISMLGKEGK
jgi:hypothetical protein